MLNYTNWFKGLLLAVAISGAVIAAFVIKGVKEYNSN